jgi:RND superfamily putative drug exporter
MRLGTAGPTMAGGRRSAAAEEVPMLTRLGRFTVRRRRLVLALTVLFMIVAAVLGTRAFGVLQDDGFGDPGSESARAEALLHERFPDDEPNAVIVVTSATGNVDDPAVAVAADQLTAELRALDDVADVTSYWELQGAPALRSTDGSRALVLAVVDDEAIEEVRDVAADAPPVITIRSDERSR